MAGPPRSRRSEPPGELAVGARWRCRPARIMARRLGPRPGEDLAADADLRRQLRHGRQAADRAVEDRGWEPVSADLDRPPRGRGDPDEAPGRLNPATDDP